MEISPATSSLQYLWTEGNCLPLPSWFIEVESDRASPVFLHQRELGRYTPDQLRDSSQVHQHDKNIDRTSRHGQVDTEGLPQRGKHIQIRDGYSLALLSKDSARLELQLDTVKNVKLFLRRPLVHLHSTFRCR